MALIAMGYPYATKVVSASNTLPLNNTRLVAGRTYYVKVAFRTRGDGDSTAAKCSSVGFIAHWDSWKQARSYIHNSAQAYAERGAFVSWTYSFTVTSDAQPTGTALYFIINNAWANGYDNQTIDLYYAKYWDSAGNVYNEWGEDCGMLNIRQRGGTYQPVFASSVKYTTPSYCFRRDGKTFYIPLAPEPSQSMSSDACTVTTANKRYNIRYSGYSYMLPQKSFRYNGKKYRIPNVISVEDIYGTLKPAAATISATSYGAWTTHQFVNDKKFSKYRTASATVSVVGFSVQKAGQKYAAGVLKASGSSGYASASGSAAINQTYTSASIGTKSISVSATTSYRPSAGSGGSGSHYIVSIPLSITLSHTNSDGVTSSALSITWPSVDLNYWE